MASSQQRQHFSRVMTKGRPIYWYQAAPSPIVLDGFPIVQKGRTFYVVKGKVVDIDRLCRVPVLPYNQDNSQIAAWVLSVQSDQWQRELDLKRVQLIAEFFKAAGNFIVNSCVITVPLTPGAVAVSHGSATISIPVTWTVTRCPSCGWTPGAGSPQTGWKFDACPECPWEGRPGEIVDGQHRIRGTTEAGTPHYNEPAVVSLLTNDQFATADMAKIFTEITTSAVDLDTLHKLVLLYKFRLRAQYIGQLDDADFRILPATPPNRNNIGLRNRRAYEIVCNLCSLQNSRWYDRVTLLPGGNMRGRRADVMDADRLVAYIEGWLRPGGALSDTQQADGMVPVNTAVGYLQDFMEAALGVWPQGSGTPAGTQTWFWNPGRNANGVLQERGIFEVFVRLFPILTKRLHLVFQTPDRQTYKEQFLYIENIDWGDPAWYELETPDKNKDMLTRILTHIYDSAPNPVGPGRLQPWVNSWIKGQPDMFSFVATPPATLPVANASQATPLKFKWEATSGITGNRLHKPINAYETASVIATQMKGGRQEIILHADTGSNEFVLESAPPSLDTSPRAANVEFAVVYSKGNLVRSISHSHPAV